ncbi:hypothetical protein KIPB_004172 [Kipferlia bialata]|uniref:PDEase domain-containing protein n=1 Tax=Kipferlia bialata TaxID=797122 RepID=A0A9K3CUM7_9EUKA|nr:hypothetical protein KIPB_004172 [Kipferlia bialata]|eukprot:g4172.t1
MDKYAQGEYEGDAYFSEVQECLLKGIMRMADISNAGRPFSVARQHSLNVMREFFRTGDLEQAYGLEITSYRDREEGVGAIIECQRSFIDYVVLRYARSFCAFASFAEKWDFLGHSASVPALDRARAAASDKTCPPLASIIQSLLDAILINREAWCGISAEDGDIVACLSDEGLVFSGSL